VAHKERLKNFRKQVDVLTLSATPIPRTLHMSLVGVRDISNLETPPEDRVPIETKVARFDEQLIRSAILRETSRGGQIFFVHNRVKDIRLMAGRLQQIVPEARIVVGHGQMPEDDLEQVMTQFINGQYDVLLSTTIIESGLDIPNANTIIINDADRFGLSDLHQLRGRVGRGKNRAYCYLLLAPDCRLTPRAAKRLQAIETFSDMGAGFAISMRDLEIRGAGNLLGTQQSGHIATVGYELYCQLLENAVRSLKNQPPRIRIDVDVDLPLSAYLPDTYVPNRRQKIDIYRRLTRVDRFDQIRDFEAEIKDRFGPIPAEARRMLGVAAIKLEAAVWGIQSIFIENKYLGFRFSDLNRIKQLANAKKGVLRIVDEETAYVGLKSLVIPPDKLLSLVKSILQSGSESY
jgi:transcription-repair coupling factor (superfamily II helicase)